MSTITAVALPRAPSFPSTSATSNARVAALVDTATRVANPPSDTRLPPPSAPITAQPVSAAARSFAESISAFDVNHMNIGELDSDSLTAAFLKLNISDPNENVETHDALYTAASNLRQAAIDEEEKENDRVEELQHEATKYAAATTTITGIMKISNTLSKALISASPLAAALIGGVSQVGLAVLDSKNKAKELTLAEALQSSGPHPKSPPTNSKTWCKTKATS